MPTPRAKRHLKILWPVALVFVLAILASNPVTAQTYAVIHYFTGGPGGQAPSAGLVMDRSGTLYGTTATGGGGTCNIDFGNGCGIVYQLKPNGYFKTLWQFTGGNDGAVPLATLILVGPALYGSTGAGGGGNCQGQGFAGCGTVFRLLPPVSPPHSIQDDHWIESILHSFQADGMDGQLPSGNLVRDQAGDLYGSTSAGGSAGAGVVFELAPSNGSWNESLLHVFNPGNNDGENPAAGVTLDAAGNIYGTTLGGGVFGFGTVYQLMAGSGWMEDILYSFTGGPGGYSPYSGVAFDSSDNLYGTTQLGGPNNGGTAFELSSEGWAYQLLYGFSGTPGSYCGPHLNTLIFDQQGNLYGTTYCDGQPPPNNYGSVFKLTLSNGTWTYTSLHDFTGGSDGGGPIGNLVFDANGNLYGTASFGGNLSRCYGMGCGVIFRITP